MVTDKLYCVDLLAELRTVGWLVIQSIPQTRLLRVVRISYKCSISYFHIFIKKPKSFIKWKQVFYNYFLAWFIYGSNVSLRYSVGRKNFPVICKFFCKENIRFASNVNFTSKILISGLLIKLHIFNELKLAVKLCVKSTKSIAIYRRLKKLLRIKK